MGCCSEDVSDPSIPKQRSCTDVIWLVLFIVFCFFMIFIASFSFVYGNPLRLVNGYDSFGNICGYSKNEKIPNLNNSGLDTTSRPYLFYMNSKKIKNSLKICVKKCPNKNLEKMKDIEAFYSETGSKLCLYDFDFNEVNNPKISQMDPKDSINSQLGPCPLLPIYKSDPLFHRCVPDVVKDFALQIVNSWDTIEQTLSDMHSTWREILALSFLAFVLSLIMVAVLHLLASIVAWIFMIFVSVASVGGTIFLWFTYANLRQNINKKVDSGSLPMDEELYNVDAFLAYAIIATIISIVLLLLVFVMRKRVQFLADLFEESAKCLGNVPLLFLQPIITFLALLGFFAFWTAVIMCLSTATYPGLKPYFPFRGVPEDNIPVEEIVEGTTLKPTNKSLAGYKKFTWVEFVDPAWVRYFWWVYLIGLVWISEFILACQQMVISGAVSLWYFNKKSSEGITPVLTSTQRLVCYHMGSVAKGSFLVTIFKVPRLILTYLHAKMQAHKETSVIAEYGLKCCICCIYCFENFIRFMNHNAYTVIAMEGVNFCTAGRIAFTTLGSNALRLLTVNSVGDFILFLGKCFVTAVTGSVGLVFMKSNSELHFYAIPVLVSCIFAYLIADAVLSLYEIVIDTMFMCVCEDERINPNGGTWQTSTVRKYHKSDEGNELEVMNKKQEQENGVE